MATKTKAAAKSAGPARFIGPMDGADRERGALPEQVALVLQGGGALGSFQAGVLEALWDHNIPVTCVAGISIGAVNAALIAGNPPEKRLDALREFWNLVSDGPLNMLLWPSPDDNLRELQHGMAAATVSAWGIAGFFNPRWVPPMLAPKGSDEAISWYDTKPLAETLDRMVDWDLLNDGPVRIAVGAVDVENGNFRYFDSKVDVDGNGKTRIDARHIMASGALPPGFPPVEIDGRHYWDGGLVSNTPLAHVLDTQGDNDMLVFQIDLFSARGDKPETLMDVWTREKDIQYSSRTRQVTDQYLRLRQEHETIRRLLDKLPAAMQADEDAERLRAYVTDYPVNVVQLIYRQKHWETGAKDFEFSRASMLDHWAEGKEAVYRSIHNGDILAQNIADGKTAAFDLDPPSIARK